MADHPPKDFLGFLGAWLVDAFGKAWGILGAVTVILPFAYGWIEENRPKLDQSSQVKWLHSYQDFWIPFWIALFACVLRIVKAPYDLYRKQFSRAEALEERLKPKLEYWFNMDDAICLRTNERAIAVGIEETLAPWNQTVFRLAVKAKGDEAVEGCRGVLTRISFEGDDSPLYAGNNHPLAFAPNDDEFTDNKRINHDPPEALDMLFLEFVSGNKWRNLMGTKGHVWPTYFMPVEQMFRREGVYTFQIHLVSTNAPSESFEVKFTLSHRLGQSRAELIRRPPRMQPDPT